MQEPLPAPRRLLTGLFHSLAALPPPDGPVAAAPALRPLLVTLHVLFPALVLPALDLLDRRRVVRWVGREGGGGSEQGRRRRSPLYQVRGGDMPHVVYLRAWHCTCASFALRADVADGSDNNDDGNDDDDGDDDDDDDGTRLYFSTPPCRHLLACLLADAWPGGLRGCVVDGPADADGPAAAVLAGVVAGVQ